MVDHMLIKPNMDLYTKIPSSRLINTIDKFTNLAKNKYGVDMGPLFYIKSRDISVGNYAVMGNSSLVTKIRVEPNDAAFAAIDVSKTQEENRLKEEMKAQRVIEEVSAIQEEGNYIVSEGEVIIPDNLPRINIKC